MSMQKVWRYNCILLYGLRIKIRRIPAPKSRTMGTYRCTKQTRNKQDKLRDYGVLTSTYPSTNLSVHSLNCEIFLCLKFTWWNKHNGLWRTAKRYYLASLLKTKRIYLPILDRSRQFNIGVCLYTPDIKGSSKDSRENRF